MPHTLQIFQQLDVVLHNVLILGWHLALHNIFKGQPCRQITLSEWMLIDNSPYNPLPHHLDCCWYTIKSDY